MTHRKITTEIALPADCCAGHFPGRPLVPGVLQLLFVERALADATADGASLAEISRVRWRKPVTPSDRLRLSASLEGVRARFELSVDRTVVCDGSVGLGRLPTAPAEPEAASTHVGVGPTPTALLPHRPPMLFVERVVTWDEHGGQCRGRIDPDACLAADARLVPASAALEFAAQAMGAVELCRSGHVGSPRIGFLVAASNTVLSVRDFPVDAPLIADVGATTWSPPMARSSVRVTLADREILTCNLTTWESDD